MTQEGTENLKSPITTTEIVSVIKNLPLKKTTSQAGHLYQIFKEEIIPILHKIL